MLYFHRHLLYFIQSHCKIITIFFKNKFAFLDY